MTGIIQIGNTDNKLTQLDWSIFIKEIKKIIVAYGGLFHFSGGSSAEEPWQNYCLVFEFTDVNVDDLLLTGFKSQIEQCRDFYKQDSVAFTIGTTEFI